MRPTSFVNVVIIEPVCPARPAASRFRRAFVRPILTRPPIRAIQPSSLLQIGVKAFSHGVNMICLHARNLSQNRRKKFHLNCVPRQVSIKRKMSSEVVVIIHIVFENAAQMIFA
jgi:hypothetical protein